MKVHFVFAHPNLDSFNGQLRNLALNLFTENNISYTVTDLYQNKFKASADQSDFTYLSNLGYFDLQSEQIYAIQNGNFVEDIKREHQLSEESDLVIFQFPLWWYSMPALLKGYIDRVFSMGWAYGGGQALKGKKILISTTTGSPQGAWTEDNRGTIKDILKHLLIGTFALTGLEPVEPFIVYGAKRLSDDQKTTCKNDFRKHLSYLMDY